MFDIEKAKAYDKMMNKIAEARSALMVAQGKAYTAGLYEFNDRFINLYDMLGDFQKELQKTFVMKEQEP